ncbi:MAG: carboxypeptidase-like regulatory domain-containing protein [Pseudomonadota bacterium]
MSEQPVPGTKDAGHTPRARRWWLLRLVGIAALLGALVLLLWYPLRGETFAGAPPDDVGQGCDPRSFIEHVDRERAARRNRTDPHPNAAARPSTLGAEELQQADTTSTGLQRTPAPAAAITVRRHPQPGSEGVHKSERPCRVVGDLLGPEEPARSARVILQRAKMEPPAVREQTVRFNDIFRFETVEQGLYVLFAQAPGLVSARYQELLSCEGEGEQFDVRLVLKPQRGRLIGEVTDTEGVPLAEVRVRYFTTTPVWHGPPVLVDERGRFTIGFADEKVPYLLFTRAPGYMESTHDLVSPAGEQHLFIRLERESLVHGVVVGPDGPLADVTVATAAPRTGKLPEFGHTTSEANGRFVVPAMPQGGWLVARHQGLFGRLRLEPFEPGHDLHQVTLRLAAGRVVHGVVVDEERRPLPDTLCYSWIDEAFVKTEVRSDAQGRFDAVALPSDWSAHIGCFIGATIMPPELEQIAPPGVDEVTVMMPASTK